jgi:hypothetical protein
MPEPPLRTEHLSGTWEISHDGETWEKDFDLNYTRA